MLCLCSTEGRLSLPGACSAVVLFCNRQLAQSWWPADRGYERCWKAPGVVCVLRSDPVPPAAAESEGAAAELTSASCHHESAGGGVVIVIWNVGMIKQWSLCVGVVCKGTCNALCAKSAKQASKHKAILQVPLLTTDVVGISLLRHG